MDRTVKISEEAYQRLSHQAKEAGIPRREYLSKLILSQPVEAPKMIIATKSPKSAETKPKSPSSVGDRSRYARWMRGETEKLVR